jgi:hypothetical protein
MAYVLAPWMLAVYFFVLAFMVMRINSPITLGYAFVCMTAGIAFFSMGNALWFLVWSR